MFFSHVQLFATPWTIARQTPLSMEFSRQEYWSGKPIPSPGDLPGPGIKPKSPALAGRFFLPSEPSRKPHIAYSTLQTFTYFVKHALSHLVVNVKG